MKMVNNATGEAVYYNPVRKAGKGVWVPHTGPHAPSLCLLYTFPAFIVTACLFSKGKRDSFPLFD